MQPVKTIIVSDNENLYTDITEPLGHESKKRNNEFFEEYSKVVNKFSFEFMGMFCDPDGAVFREKVVQFNSGSERTN